MLPHQVPRSTCFFKKKTQANESENLAQSFLTKCPTHLLLEEEKNRQVSLRTWKPGSMLSYQVPTATRQSVPNLWSSSSLMTYNDDNTYHLISCKLRSNNFELSQTVFCSHFYLLLCHDKVPKHACVKTNCKENNISQEYKKHCVSRVCRVRCKTHGSFVTVIMDKQTRKMYIRFQTSAVCEL